MEVSLAQFALALVEGVLAAAAQPVELRELVLSVPFDPGPGAGTWNPPGMGDGAALTLEELRRMLRAQDRQVRFDWASLAQAPRERLARLEVRVRLP